ncbi:PIG-L deacetylase family protein [Bacillus pseudomycoides]|uniref:PIG-L domain-containing protein n=1 Tax=Bacillus pseudomycoides TaxID=64104 RepID=A0A2B6JW69_9BACI|nr:PIG-L deacetylase family protein [Bacillus pseudomycoides]PDY47159.1 PIG-L domain-containing protein [Bacillus pseudomycoides]PEA84525.1 PIG-L domain-containing protein [Bacillus pseudomycoides]PED05195.1 PIG-L domain-containing protein [Bacillus pseudomycoides]PED71793.1 PIG-L domain-containing protein [Bacillus pseudomycoides]PEI39057.1 PIG-L domain-containing protein [Bacillus pseudomycoides]
MRECVLVIGAHPDDELLGAGGTLKRLVENGYRVISIITALGRKEEAHHIQQLSRCANKVIGIEEVIFLKHANLELELIPLHQLTKEIEQLIQTYKPSKIFTHHYGDVNIDHLITFQAVLTATRPLPNQKPIELITFETVSSSEWNIHTNDKAFKSNYFVDITDQMDSKIAALKHYDVEMRDFPHPRSYEGVQYLGRVRGMTIGVQYAEAFEVVRRIWR